MIVRKKWAGTIVLFLCAFIIISQLLFSPPKPSALPQGRHRSSYIGNSSLKKVTIAHYTTNYGFRTDSQSKIFNGNMQSICEMLDPEEFFEADAVITSLVDLVRLPTIDNSKELYRQKHASQLWLFHVEESPRNSYRTVQMESPTYLDDWFNLTATLKPESDLHIQYRVSETNVEPVPSKTSRCLLRVFELNRPLACFCRKSSMSL
jgi:hypothetical protein